MPITRHYQRGQKSTSLETSRLVYRQGAWWAEWVWNEERDRQIARATIPPARAAFKRLMAASRSS